MNRFTTLIAIALGLLVIHVSGNAQFTDGSDYIGGTVGLSNIGSSAALGVDYEHCLAGKVGPGYFGVGAQAHYWSYDYNYYGAPSSWSYNYFSLSATGSYHFSLGNKKWDPFVLLAVGYHIVSFSEPDWYESSYNYSYDHSRMFVGAQIGSRYFLTPNVALQARLGFGAELLSVGVDWKF